MDRTTRQMRSVASEFQTRADEGTGDLYISGYFSVFNSNYEIWPGATESVSPEAFDGALSDDIRCLIDHETRLVLGRNQDAMNLFERVKRGDVNQCSFGFEILDEEFEDRGTEVHWTIKKVKLYEVSVVTFPAYDETEVSARKQDYRAIQKRKHEAWKDQALKKLKGEQ